MNMSGPSVAVAIPAELGLQTGTDTALKTLKKPSKYKHWGLLPVVATRWEAAE